MLPLAALRQAIGAAAADHAAGRVQVPPRAVCAVDEGLDLLTMLAAAPGMSVAKVISVARASAHRAGGVFGRVIVFDAGGQPIGVFDAAGITAQRTAAVSAFALQHLLPQLSGPIVLVGTGVQAIAHVDALAVQYPGATLTVVGRNQPAAEALATRARKAGLQAVAQAEASPALTRAAELLVTATSSGTPVLPDAIGSRAVIVAVGNYRAHCSELPATLVQRCRVYVDSLHGAQAEAGELIAAGLEMKALQALDAGVIPARAPDGPTLFKSVGSALWDLAFARCAWGEAHG